MNGLDNTMVKMSLIVVVAGVLVFMAKTYEKQLGTNVSYSLMGLVAVAALYALIVVNSEESESFVGGDDMTSTTESTVEELNNQLVMILSNYYKKQLQQLKFNENLGFREKSIQTRQIQYKIRELSSKKLIIG